MPGDVFLLPFRPGLDANAIPIVGARLEFYASQLGEPDSPGTTMPQAVFANEALTVSLGPVVEANSAGVWPTIYLDKAKTYRVVMRSPNGDVLLETDPYVLGATDTLAPEVAENAALAARSAGQAEGFALLLALTSGGYVNRNDSRPPFDTPEGDGYLFTLNGGFFLGFNQGGQAADVVEFATTASQSSQLEGILADLASTSTGKGGSLVGLSHTMPSVPATAIDRFQRELLVTDAPFFADSANTDDMSSAMQAAADYAKANGFGKLRLPSGEFRWDTPVTIDNSDDSQPNTTRLSIVGDAARGSIIKMPGTAMTALTIIGSNNPGAADAQVKIENLYFDQNSKNGTCLSLNRLSHVTLEDVRCNGSDLAIACTDVQESEFRNVVCAFANLGVKMQPGSFTSPNNIMMHHCKMGNNAYGGADFINAAQINIIGGSYEGNHLNPGESDPARVMFAIRAIWNDAGKIEGSVGLNVIGAYIEANGMGVDSSTPTGDIWIVNSVAPMVNTISGCSFQRHDEFYLRNNIRMETSGGFRHQLNLMGNGHKGFYGYTPSVDRRAVFVSNPAETYVNEMGCSYADAVERPDWSGLNNTSHDSNVQAYARFNGGAVASGAIAGQQSFNIFAINKVSTGVFDITFARPLSGGVNVPQVQIIGSYGFATVVSESVDGMRVQTADTAGTLADFQLAFSVFGKPLA